MRRSWIGAASAAALTTVVGASWVAAQEPQPRQDQTPAKHEMQKGQRGETAQAPAPLGQQQAPGGASERGQPPRSGMQKEEGGPGKAAEGERRQGEKRSGQAQTENNNGGDERSGQRHEPQIGAGAEAQTGGGAERGNIQGQAQSGQNERLPATGSGSAPAPRRTGGNVQAMGATHISNESASRIANALLATAAPQNFNVDVSVDGLLPGELDLRPLPPAVVELIPEYRGYEYVVANEEVFIVQPSTRRVVEIIREGGPTQAMEGPQRINLTDAQQRMLLASVRSAGLPEARESAELADGATVPADVTLEPVPQAVVVEIPMIERYRLFVANDRVVLVDPDTREVVDVVR